MSVANGQVSPARSRSAVLSPRPNKESGSVPGFLFGRVEGLNCRHKCPYVFLAWPNEQRIGSELQQGKSCYPSMYNKPMQTKVLIVGVVKKNDTILMRKKPDGSPPYKETWYIFGTEATPGISLDEAIKAEVLSRAGVIIAVKNKISWDTEIKRDLDGVKKFFVYLDVECEYVGGELQLSEDIEKLEWVKQEDLDLYDIVPPSRVLFEKLGYLQ